MCGMFMVLFEEYMIEKYGLGLAHPNNIFENENLIMRQRKDGTPRMTQLQFYRDRIKHMD
jgi:hypothetical protein